MTTDDPNDLSDVDREIRINEMQHEAAELTGEDMSHWQSDDSPPELMEKFWEHVLAYEQAPWTSYYEQLQQTGIQLPAADKLDDEQVSAKLDELIKRLAEVRVFLSSTDHLNDRELYELLCGEVLHEQTKDLAVGDGSASHIDLVSSGSERATYLYLKYYADEDARVHWCESFPDYEVPPHEDPPHDRDRLLPAP